MSLSKGRRSLEFRKMGSLLAESATRVGYTSDTPSNQWVSAGTSSGLSKNTRELEPLTALEELPYER